MPLMAQPPKNLQESLLAVLLFKNRQARIVAGQVDVKLWDEPYRDLVREIYKYVKKYNRAPKDHADDLLDALPGSVDADSMEATRNLLRRLGRIRNTVNADYTLERLFSFIRRQSIKSAIMAAAPLVMTDDDTQLDQAEALLTGAMKQRMAVFDRGVSVGDIMAVRNAFDQETREGFDTGIGPLDDIRAMPMRKEMHLLIGGAGHGKTWWLTHLARQAARRKHRVLHVTLEVGQNIMLRRYIQAYLALTQERLPHDMAKLIIKPGKRGRMEVTNFGLTESKASARDPDGRFEGQLEARVTALRARLSRIRIKEFPSGMLSLQALIAYLDMLEADDGFIPDLLLLDYPDLMKLSGGIEHKRQALGQLFVDLRGVAGERNIGLATVTQGNRKFVESTRPDETMVAEDWSKIATADTIIIQQKKEREAALGMARLFVAKSRNGPDKITVAITQNLAAGQYCVQSAFAPNDYYEMLMKSQIMVPQSGPKMRDDTMELEA